jgi:hypothetical protein
VEQTGREIGEYAPEAAGEVAIMLATRGGSGGTRGAKEISRTPATGRVHGLRQALGLAGRRAKDLLVLGGRSKFRGVRPTGGGSYFDIQSLSERGKQIERALGKDTVDSFKTFDKLGPGTGATSIKSIDLTLPSAGKSRQHSGLRRSLERAIDDIINFTGETKGGRTLDVPVQAAGSGNCNSKWKGNT